MLYFFCIWTFFNTE